MSLSDNNMGYTISYFTESSQAKPRVTYLTASLYLGIGYRLESHAWLPSLLLSSVFPPRRVPSTYMPGKFIYSCIKYTYHSKEWA